MLAPRLSSQTDDVRHVVVLRVAGPLETDDHVEALRAIVAGVSAPYGVVIDLSEVTSISQAAIEGLRALALDCGRAGGRLAIACSSLEVRTYLVVADVDTLAPLVHTSEQALPLVAAAA